MKILHLVWGFEIGGTEAMLVDILNQQCIDHNVILLVINEDVNRQLLSAINNKVEVFLLNRPRKSNNPYYWLRFMLFILKRHPDIIHSHQNSLLKFLKLFKAPKVVTMHDTGIKLSKFIQLVDEVFCISRAVLEDLKSRLPNKKLKIVANGIPVNRISIKRSYTNQSIRIVQLARLDHHKKGQDVLLRAFALLLQSQPEIACTLDFIGSGPSNEWLQTLATSLNIQDKCRFLGAIPRDYLFEHLCDYDLLVQPSRYEGFGLSVAEAMAARVPVLVSDIEGPMEIIEHGKYGYFFKSEDATDCAKGIARIINERAEHWFLEEMEARRQHVIQLYDVSNTANLYLDEYKILLATVKA